MSSLTVCFLPSGIKVTANKGDNLLQVAAEAGLHINSSCGGEGACGKCRVFVKSGSAVSKDSGLISSEDSAKGARLACQTTLTGDIQILIPEDSQLDRKSAPRSKVKIHESIHINREFEQHLAPESFVPPIKKYYTAVAPPTLSDNSSDLGRLLRTLKQEHRIENVSADLPVLKKLPHALRKSQWGVTVSILQTNDARLVNVEEGNTAGKNYTIAFDIGTTSVWGQLIDMESRKVLAEASAYNPQIPYGDDVITRIVFSQKKGGLKKLQEAVVAEINKIIRELLSAAHIEIKNVSYITAAGNTVMMHLMFGLDPKYIRETPYIPVSSFIPSVKAADIGIDMDDHVYLYAFPSVASYVGGDIVAGVLSSGMYKSSKVTLYIDIGTNGEIVLGNTDWLMTASCSAGPAFEGGGLKCGMRATTGAIEGFSFNDDTLEPMIITIGMKKPKGICGSGAINILAEFLRTGIIDQSGKFNRSCASSRIRKGETGYEYVLAGTDEAKTDADIVITEADIDNLIRAKAAMFAGCHALVERSGLSFQDIEQVIIAGAFGDFIDLEKTIAIGLMPDIPRDRYRFIGNGSLLGAKLAGLSRELQLDAERIARSMTNIELSEDASFMEKYIAGIFLPHTDIKLFPTVGRWLNPSIL